MPAKRTLQLSSVPRKINRLKKGNQVYYRIRLSKEKKLNTDFYIFDETDLVFYLEKMQVEILSDGSVATKKKERIGWIVVEKIDTRYKGKKIWQTHSKIDKRYRGKGFGLLLYRHAIDYCHRKNMQVFSSGDWSKQAERLYRSRHWGILGYRSLYNKKLGRYKIEKCT